MPGTTWVPEPCSGSITERIVTINVVPVAGTRWLAPTCGSATRGPARGAGADGFVAAGLDRAVADAGIEIVRVVVLVSLAPHADGVRPASTSARARTGFRAHSLTAPKRSRGARLSLVVLANETT